MEIENILVKFDFSKVKGLNDKGERKFNIEYIMSYLKQREGKGLVRDICTIIGEPRVYNIFIISL